MGSSIAKRVVGSLCLPLALAATPASAYDLSTHEQITREAVALVGRCARENARLRDPSAHVATLIDLNLRQDDTLRKARLWHFPFVAREGCDDPCREECYTRDWCPYWLSFICEMPVYRSFDPWVNHLIRRAAYAREPLEVYRAAGALLHYLQDLAVPAHALPIFHPVPVWHGDELDGYGVTASHCNLRLEDARDPCARLEEISDVASLLLRVRASTLRSLETSFPLRSAPPAERRWTVFWRSSPDSQAPEFKLYGCKEFGAPQVTCADEAFQVEAKTYAQFAEARASEAILASAQLIVYLQKQIAAGVSSKRADAQAAIDRWLPSRDRLQRIAREHPEACRALGNP